MIDQSFSVKNLFDIFNNENDKGVNLISKYFLDAEFYYENIRRVRKMIWVMYKRRRNYDKAFFEERIVKLYDLLRLQKKRRDEYITGKLSNISEEISRKEFELKVKKLEKKINNKDVYSLGDCALSFFAEKQIQRNIKKIFGVKQADRELIVPQIISTLKDKIPKIIVKTDIKSFYESINKERLIGKIHQSQSLSLQTRKIVSRLINSFDGGASSDRGIPRGVGVSAYLAELYMKSFDDAINEIDDLVYYSRYVDDIILIMSPSMARNGGDYLALVKKLLDGECLIMNEDQDKTKVIDFPKLNNKYSFDYLGYNFTYDVSNLKIRMSKKKLDKYELKVNSAFDEYHKKSKKQPRRSSSELSLRMKFLTHNTRLSNNKSNALIGIYNANKWITELNQLVHLDNIVKRQVSSLKDLKLKKRVSAYSFVDGFKKKKYSNFSINDYLAIGKIWRVK